MQNAPWIFSLICLTLPFTSNVTAATPNAYLAANSTDRIIVKLKPSNNPQTAKASVETAMQQAGISASYKKASSNKTHIVQLAHPLALSEARAYAAQLSRNPSVAYAEPDQLMFPSDALTPNDTSYANQWHLSTADSNNPSASNLPAAWAETTGTNKIVVAVVDTGVLNHVDLVPRLIGGNAASSGYDFVSFANRANDGNARDNNPSDTGDWVSTYDVSTTDFSNCNLRDSTWHGTHVAGIIGAASNNGRGVSGVDWQAKLLTARVLGKCGGYLSDIADAIRWSAGESIDGVANPNPAKVINLSLGGTGACGQTYQDAINSAVSRGATVVVAAGNAAADVSSQRPANCQNVITVAALNKVGGRASFSNYGSQVDIAAPGVSILSTLDSGKTTPNNDNSYAYYDGTSMAAPQVSGVIALMLAANPKLTDGSLSNVPALVEARLKAASRSFPTTVDRACTTATCGAGILDAYQAIRAVKLPPTVNAGAALNVQTGMQASLQANASDAFGDVVTYQWTQIAGTSVSLSNNNSLNPSFTAPNNADTLKFRLTATNVVGLSANSEVTVTVANAMPKSACDASALNLNQVSNGQWQTTCLATHRTTRHYASYYSFSLTQASTVTIDLSSSAQDSYLYLLSGASKTGKVLSANDDANGSLNSQITQVLAAGTYTLEASTYAAQKTGNFSIKVNASALTNVCKPNPIQLGQSLNTTWLANTCSATHRGKAFNAQYYSFTLTSSTKVVIDVSSNQDTYLYLLNGAETNSGVLAQNDDSKDSTNSQIVQTLNAGTYVIEATTFRPNITGDLKVSLTAIN
jgi:serine protease